MFGSIVSCVYLSVSMTPHDINIFLWKLGGRIYKADTLNLILDMDIWIFY